jgi:hypothetical protein
MGETLLALRLDPSSITRFEEQRADLDRADLASKRYYAEADALLHRPLRFMARNVVARIRRRWHRG